VKITFEGEITGTDTDFSVRVSLGKIPTYGQAQEIGKALHEALCGYFESKGAKLVQSSGDAPIIGSGSPKLILHS